ncbi:uncharacterized protein C8A04DRAFT_28325 [Dichotomopilus funicola]|uniref:Uncharacterized protein n=1 Tax=Dichotomopilus funicola TaxID=1934379 RepID=A0AAN6V3Y1_9PEZI|nr:hypothetical protein C8A04DRAFT_28325 [Dichotomopilus funicola]
MTVIIGQAPNNLGPLTTTFTPPPACTVAVGAATGGLGGWLGLGGQEDVAYLGQACSWGKAYDDTGCWPETTAGVAETKAPLYGWGFYSPGLHCPVGYATACSATGGSGGGSEWPVQFKLRDGETAVGCCPSGYGCANNNGQTCTMMATSTAVPTVTCDGDTTGGLGTMTVPNKEASITTFSVYAPMIQINWQSSDRSHSTSSSSSRRTSTTKKSSSESTHTSSSATKSSHSNSDDHSHTASTSATETLVTDDSPSPTGGQSTGGPNQPTNTPPTLQEGQTSSGDDGPLSPGAKVAIGVTCAVAVLVFAVCALFYFWRKRKNAQEEQDLDRMYGLQPNMVENGAFGNAVDDPGFYRGQRQVTAPSAPPTQNPFEGSEVPSSSGGTSEVQRPAAPYYKPYRPPGAS